MTALNAVITRAGLRYVRDRMHSAQAPVISHIAVGDAAPYSASATQTALHNERARLEIAGFQTPAINILHTTALYDDPDASHEITEVGLLADDGTLLAVFADPTINLGWKSANVPRLFAWDWIIDVWDLTQVQVTVAEPALSLFFGEEVTALAASDAQLSRLLLEARRRIHDLERERDDLRAEQARLTAQLHELRVEMQAAITTAVDDLRSALTDQLGLIAETDALATQTATQLLTHRITEH